MIEYIFFDAASRDRFVKYAASQDVNCTLLDDPMGMVVAVPEDIADETEEALERCHGELEQEQSELLIEEDGGLRQPAGFRYLLPDGQPCLVPPQPETANRLHAGEEHLCKILAAEKNKPNE